MCQGARPLRFPLYFRLFILMMRADDEMSIIVWESQLLPRFLPRNIVLRVGAACQGARATATVGRPRHSGYGSHGAPLIGVQIHYERSRISD
eukprot:COSAG01_NODE_1998_length_8689_cov_36.410943_8_plen_92_part_00